MNDGTLSIYCKNCKRSTGHAPDHDGIRVCAACGWGSVVGDEQFDERERRWLIFMRWLYARGLLTEELESRRTKLRRYYLRPSGREVISQ